MTAQKGPSAESTHDRPWARRASSVGCGSPDQAGSPGPTGSTPAPNLTRGHVRNGSGVNRSRTSRPPRDGPGRRRAGSGRARPRAPSTPRSPLPDRPPATPRGQRAGVRWPWNRWSSSATGTIAVAPRGPGSQLVQTGRRHHEHGSAESLGRRSQRHPDGRRRRRGPPRSGWRPRARSARRRRGSAGSRATGRAASSGRRGARAAEVATTSITSGVAGPRRTASPPAAQPRRVGRTPSGWGTGRRRWPAPPGHRLGRREDRVGPVADGLERLGRSVDP